MSELQHALRHAAERARMVDTRVYEIAPLARVRRELVPAVDAAIGEAMGVLGCLLDRYDTPTPTSGPEDSGVFDVVFEHMVEQPAEVPARRQRVADVTFMARWELARKRSAMAAAHEREDTGLLSRCCSACRRVVKATSGVERVLCDVEGHPSVFDGLYQNELQIALATRAAYHSFAQGLVHSSPADGRVGRGVRLAGVGIACLVGRDVYQDLRMEDRLEVRALQQRLLAWLRAPTDVKQGHRLLTDVHAFASLLMRVNARPILVLHDRELLQRLRVALEGVLRGESAGLPAYEPLRGRDPKLDEFIDAEVLEAGPWITAIEHVLEDLWEETP